MRVTGSAPTALFTWCQENERAVLHAQGLNALGSLRAATGDLRGAEQAIQEGLRLAAHSGERRLLASLRVQLASIAGRLGDRVACEEHARAVLVMDPDEAPDLGATARFHLSVALMESGRTDEAQSHANAGWAAAKRAGHAMLVADFRRLLANIELVRGNFDLAEEHSSACLAAYEASESSLLTIAMNQKGWIALQRNRLSDAEAALRRALALAEESGRPTWESRTVLPLMLVAARRRDWRAFAQLEDRLRTRKDVEFLETAEYVFAESALEALSDGRRELALRLLAEAEAHSHPDSEQLRLDDALARARATIV